MKAENKIKKSILLKYSSWNDEYTPPPLDTDEKVEGEYTAQNKGGALQDAREDLRQSGIDTTIEAPMSRHYEVDFVATQMDDGSWVGWPYFHGGGKHSEPESIDWIGMAHDLDCKETQKTVTVREFTKKTEATP